MEGRGVPTEVRSDMLERVLTRQRWMDNVLLLVMVMRELCLGRARVRTVHHGLTTTVCRVDGVHIQRGWLEPSCLPMRVSMSTCRNGRCSRSGYRSRSRDTRGGYVDVWTVNVQQLTRKVGNLKRQIAYASGSKFKGDKKREGRTTSRKPRPDNLPESTECT